MKKGPNSPVLPPAISLAAVAPLASRVGFWHDEWR